MKLAKYKVYYSLSLATELMLKWGWLPIAWHVVYFLINISERISPQLERLLLGIYPTFLLAFVVAFSLKAWRAFCDFDRKMENTYDLNFEWINFKHALKERNNAFSYKDFKRILEACSMRPFFSQTKPLRVGKWTLAGLTIVLTLHLSFYNLVNRFAINLKSILSPPSVAVQLHHPNFVKEGDSFPIRFTGDLPEGRLVLTSGEKVIDQVIKNDATTTITNITARIDGELRFKEGRFAVTKPIKPEFAAKPNLQSLDISIRDPIEERWTTHKGILELNVYDNSLGRLNAAIQASQTIKDVFLNDNKVLDSVDGNRLEIRFKTPVKSNWSLRFVNEHDLSSKPIALTFNRMTNEEPIIYFVGVEAEKFLASNQRGYVGYIAQDDVSIKKVVLFMSVHSPQEEAPIDSEQVQLFTNNKKQHIRQLEEEHRISLKNLDMRQDTFVRYYLMVEDFYGLKGYTSTNLWKQKNLIERLDSRDKLIGEVEQRVSEKLAQLKDLLDEKKDLDLLKEQGKLTEERLKSHEDNVKATKEELANLGEELEELVADENLSEEDQAANEKLLELLEDIAQLEESLYDENEEDPEQASNGESEEQDLQQLKEKLEQYKEELEQLKEEAERENLDVIAEEAHQLYEDMLLNDSIDLLSPKAFSNSKSEIANLLKELENRFDSFKEGYTPPDEESEDIVDELADLMDDKTSDKVMGLGRDNLNPPMNPSMKDEGDSPSQDQSLSNQINSIRTNFRNLARRQLMADFEAIYETIYNQVNGLLAQNKTINHFSNSQALDPSPPNSTAIGDLTTLFLVDYESLTKDYKFTMDELISGFVRDVQSLLEMYDEQVFLITSLRSTGAQDAARGNGATPYIHSTGGQARSFGDLLESSKTISGRLLDLKAAVEELQRLMELQQARAAAGRGQDRMGNQLSRMQKGGGEGQSKKPKSGQGQAGEQRRFSEAERNYLQQLAKQQAENRRRLERALKALEEGQGGKPKAGGEADKPKDSEGEAGAKPSLAEEAKQPASGEGPKERGGKLSEESLQALKKATELMKQIEEELKKAVSQEDVESLKKAQKLNQVVMDNLLKGQQGNLKKKKEEDKKKDDERKVEREKKDYKGNLKPLDEEATAYKKKTVRMQKIRSIPSHYRKRLDFIYDEIYSKDEAPQDQE